MENHSKILPSESKTVKNGNGTSVDVKGLWETVKDGEGRQGTVMDF